MRRSSLFLAGGFALLVMLALLAMASGRYALTPSEIADSVYRSIAGQRSLRMSDEVLWQIRLPRIALACLVGAALGAAGAAFQHLFRNPLVAPDTLGVSSGAALGAVLAIFVGRRRSRSPRLPRSAAASSAVAIVTRSRRARRARPRGDARS